MSINSLKGTEKGIVYKLRNLVVQSFLPHHQRVTIEFKIRCVKTLLGEIKASFDWHNPDDNETVLLPPLH